MPDAVAQFAKAKYLNLETFRKSGIGVRTPVWFAQAPAPLEGASGQQYSTSIPRLRRAK